MRRWLVLLSLTVLPVIGCQTAITPGDTPTVREQRSAVEPQKFATLWRRRGWGRGWGRGFYGGFGYRGVVATPYVRPYYRAAVYTPVVSTVVYPTYAGAYGYFW